MSTESIPHDRGHAMTRGRRRPPRPFDLLVADVQGIHERLRNQVIPELRTLEVGQRRMDRKLVDIDRRLNGVDERFAAVDERFNAVDERFNAVDERFAAVDERFAAVDERFNAVDERFNAVDERFNTLEEDIDTRFDRVDESLGEILGLVRYMLYGGEPGDDPDQTTLWESDEGSDEGETEGA